jgi:polyhydroxyalkanoate synthesis regulator phasin
MKKLILAVVLSTQVLSFNVSREDTSKMIDSMVKQGVLSPQQADMAKKEMSGLSDQQWQEVQKKGAAFAAQMKKKNQANPTVNLGAGSAAQNIDFDSPEFKKIQQQMSEILK